MVVHQIISYLILLYIYIILSYHIRLHTFSHGQESSESDDSEESEAIGCEKHVISRWGKRENGQLMVI